MVNEIKTLHQQKVSLLKIDHQYLIFFYLMVALNTASGIIGTLQNGINQFLGKNNDIILEIKVLFKGFQKQF